MKPATPPARGQAGMALIDALVALAVLGLGMAALVRLSGSLHLSADLARQQGEALVLAAQELEAARAAAQQQGLAHPPQATRPLPATAPQDVAGANTLYTVARSTPDVQAQALPELHAIQATVSWQDREGGLQRLELHSLASAADPRRAALLQRGPAGTPSRRPGSRDARIPADARDLGDDISAFQPSAAAGIVWLFEHQNGTIVGECQLGTPLASLSLADVATCRSQAPALLLSGRVRFSNAAVPDLGRPQGRALPLGLQLTLTSTGHAPGATPRCLHNAPSQARSQPGGVVYHCKVPLNQASPPHWSGRLDLTSLPLGPGQHRVCRYSRDHDGDGRIANAEHPAHYDQVTTALVHQNFLVIPFDRPCPESAGAPAHQP